MSAKKKAAAAPQDNSPEQIVEDAGADESRPGVESEAADAEAGQLVVLSENGSYSTHAGENEASSQDDGSTPSARVARDAAWATKPYGEFFAGVTAEALADLGGVTDQEQVLRAVLDASNRAVVEANAYRGGTFKRLPFHRALTQAQVAQIEAHLGSAVDRAILVGVTAVQPEQESQSGSSGAGGGKSAAVTAKEIVSKFGEMYRVIRSEDGLVYAVPKDGEVLPVVARVSSVEARLRRVFDQEYGEVLTGEALKNALATVSARGLDAPRVKVAMRVSDEGDRILVDLGRDTGEVVVVTPDGWKVVAPGGPDMPETMWYRPKSMLPLPIPQRGGHRDMLGDLDRLAPSCPNRRLMWGWLLSAHTEGAQPILWAVGPHGSGKTTKAKNVVNLIDPVPLLGAEGKSETDDNVRAANRFVVTLDNSGSKITASRSDWLARIVTGFLDERRVLFTDDDMYSAVIKRPVVVTSISMPAGVNADVTERTMRLDFQRMDESERRTERQLKREFEAAAPLVLGAVYDDLAGVVARRAEVEELVDQGVVSLTRMADHSQVLHALDLHLGLVNDPDGYHGTFAAAVHGEMVDRANDDPVVRALVRLVPTPMSSWEGEPSALLEKIKPFKPESDREGWPTDAASLGRMLTKLEVSLHEVGVAVTRDHNRADGKKVRWVTLTNVSKPENCGVPAGDDAQKVALYVAALRQADHHTAHLIQMRGTLTGTRAVVLDNLAGGYYVTDGGGADADEKLWDEASGTYNGAGAMSWLSLPTQFRNRPQTLPYE